MMQSIRDFLNGTSRISDAHTSRTILCTLFKLLENIAIAKVTCPIIVAHLSKVNSSLMTLNSLERLFFAIVNGLQACLIVQFNKV